MPPDGVPLGELKREAIALIGGGPAAAFEADMLISGLTGIERPFIHSHPERLVAHKAAELVRFAARSRAEGRPLAYLLGDALFCGRRFAVDRATLIPRPETEWLAEWGRSQAKPGSLFADWCTGSGVLAVTLLLACPASRAYAVDISAAALSVAAKNAEAWGVAGRLDALRCGRPVELTGHIAPQSLDFIVANPPYVRSDELAALEAQVRQEPELALDGGREGTDVIRLLLEELPPFMKAGARLAMETAGGEQARTLAGGKNQGLVFEDLFADINGVERFMVWRKI